jgi:hypothetical protein
MLEIGFETNRGSSSIQLVKLPRFISLFLMVGDVLGLFVCLGLTSYWTLNNPLTGFDPFVCGFILLVLTGMYLSDTYHPTPMASATSSSETLSLKFLFTESMVFCFLVSLF